ncbi:hypothetical protein GCM10020001_118340 [Nonomuraea salmonea]
MTDQQNSATPDSSTSSSMSAADMQAAADELERLRRSGLLDEQDVKRARAGFEHHFGPLPDAG